MSARELRNERRRDQVREEILAATREVLLGQGLEGLTLSAIARRLELSKAALYYYFASKEALVFELVHGGLEDLARAVGDAIASARSGADAIEALIRATALHYGDRKDELRLAYLVPQVGSGVRFDAQMVARIRPLNDLVYGAVAARIRADQDAGRVDPAIDGRRLAFVAHTAVIGMLTIEGLVEVADDAPLIHTRDSMVSELAATFRARLAPPR